MDVIDLLRKTEVDNKKKILIFNPLKVDFQGKWNGQELPEYKIVSKENKAFKTSLGKHFGEHLVDLYIADRENYSREKARKLIFND